MFRALCPCLVCVLPSFITPQIQCPTPLTITRCSHLYLCSHPLAFSYKIDVKIHGLCYPFLIRRIFCWNVIFTNIPFRFYFHVAIQSWNNQEVSLYSLLFILQQCLFSRTIQNHWLVFSLWSLMKPYRTSIKPIISILYLIIPPKIYYRLFVFTEFQSRYVSKYFPNIYRSIWIKFLSIKRH